MLRVVHILPWWSVTLLIVLAGRVGAGTPDSTDDSDPVDRRLSRLLYEEGTCPPLPTSSFDLQSKVVSYDNDTFGEVSLLFDEEVTLTKIMLHFGGSSRRIDVLDNPWGCPIVVYGDSRGKKGVYTNFHPLGVATHVRNLVSQVSGRNIKVKLAGDRQRCNFSMPPFHLEGSKKKLIQFWFSRCSNSDRTSDRETHCEHAIDGSSESMMRTNTSDIRSWTFWLPKVTLLKSLEFLWLRWGSITMTIEVEVEQSFIKVPLKFDCARSDIFGKTPLSITNSTINFRGLDHHYCDVNASCEQMERLRILALNFNYAVNATAVRVTVDNNFYNSHLSFNIIQLLELKVWGSLDEDPEPESCAGMEFDTCRVQSPGRCVGHTMKIRKCEATASNGPFAGPVDGYSPSVRNHIVDFNADGLWDLLSCSSGYGLFNALTGVPPTPWRTTLYLYLRQPDGGWMYHDLYAHWEKRGQHFIRGLSFKGVDWDSDGDVDLLAIASDWFGPLVLYDNVNGTWDSLEYRGVVLDGEFSCYDAVDWDGDGDIDIIAMSYFGWSSYSGILFERQSKSTHELKQTKYFEGIAIDNYHCDLAAGDWDSDGDIDLITTSSIADEAWHVAATFFFFEQLASGKLIERFSEDHPMKNILPLDQTAVGEIYSSFSMQMIDADKDGLQDLAIGGYQFYRQERPTDPTYIKIVGPLDMIRWR